ncbi:g012 [Yersinia phage phiR1-37]|uniref:hypothetical protein n=1 Tax=Yersinia phage phiR1-37 TaxID=331278 RepID=UPI00022DBCB8|nr:hypothetical protein phiR1-37_gp012 [Yersinia phage phiR1-37]CCE26036.1 g012 [Yersinia phage phiR1-37]
MMRYARVVRDDPVFRPSYSLLSSYLVYSMSIYDWSSKSSYKLFYRENIAIRIHCREFDKHPEFKGFSRL